MNISFDARDFPQIDNLNFGNIDSDISVNSIYYMEKGKPKIYVAAEFHFERYSREFWEEELLKLKAGGIDVISAYICWLFHETKRGEYCFSGDYDDGYFLSLCKKHDLGVILRIGPYCHGELRHGALPDFVFRLPYNRSDHPHYIKMVEQYWSKLYENTKEYYDGKTVVGIQLENEYVRGYKHLVTLRELAEKVGFKVPVFTITGWGCSFDGNKYDLQGTYGGYPARPWAQHRRQMEVQGNFTIRHDYHDFNGGGIGDDIIDYSKADMPKRASLQPKMTCECGPGNQVTAHRREIISTNDAFGVPFATVANGCNWLGYYMYHGSSNPRGKLYQESRITLSPNNCPVIDYDFQAPLGRFGYPKRSFKKLKNLNYFLQHFGEQLAPMWTFYSPQLKITDSTDAQTIRMNVRVDNQGRGFLFVTTYEREKKMQPISNITVTVNTLNEKITLPSFSMETDRFLMYPFNITLGLTNFSYIMASPIAHITVGNITTYYFQTTGGLMPGYMKKEGKGTFIVSDDPVNIVNNKVDKHTQIVVLTEDIAEDFYLINNNIVFTDGVVYGDEKIIILEYKRGNYCVLNGKKVELETPKVSAKVKLKKTKPFACRYGRYLFSRGKRSYYSFLAKDLIFSDDVVDYVLDFEFGGNTLQMYSDNILVNDFFNYSGTHQISLKYFKDELADNKIINIVTAPFTRFRKVYTEKHFDNNLSELKVRKMTAYYKKRLT